MSMLTVRPLPGILPDSEQGLRPALEVELAIIPPWPTSSFASPAAPRHRRPVRHGGAARHVSGVLFAYAGDLPQISALDDYAPSTITRVYAADGEVDRRVRHPSAASSSATTTSRRGCARRSSPPRTPSSIATSALSVSRIVVTAVAKTSSKRRRRRARARSPSSWRATLFLNRARRPGERKIKEAILAIQIEKRYTKREIFTLYCNQIHFGHGAYGVEAASRLYFDKPAKDADAGRGGADRRHHPDARAPEPVRRPEARDARAATTSCSGWPTRATSRRPRRTPRSSGRSSLRGQPRPSESIAPFFVEEVRKYLEQKYGAKQLYESGLAVHTTLDADLQEAANRAVDRGLRRLDKRRGFRKPRRNVLDEGELAQFRDERWDRPIPTRWRPRWSSRRHRAGSGPAVAASPRSAARCAGRRACASAATRRTSAEGDSLDAADVRGRPVQAGRPDRRARWRRSTRPTARCRSRSSRQPLVEGAAAGHRQPHRPGPGDGGRLRASAGASSTAPRRRTARSDRLQAVRLHDGHRSRLHADDDPRRRAGHLLRRPRAAALLAAQLRPQVRGRDHAAAGARGVAQRPGRQDHGAAWPDERGATRGGSASSRRWPPYLSLALGSGDATCSRSTAPTPSSRIRACGCARSRCSKSSTATGTCSRRTAREPQDAIRADTAFVMTNLLRGVVQRGTAAAAASLDWPLAGQDRHDGRLHRRVVHRLRSRTSPSACGSATTRRSRSDRRRPARWRPCRSGSTSCAPTSTSAAIGRTRPPSRRPATSSSSPSTAAPGQPLPGDSIGGITEAFIAGTQPGGFRQ